MKEAADVLGFFSTSEGTLRFLALLFPGFIALSIYDLRIPGERRKWSDMGVGLVAYSILIDILVTIYLRIWPLTTNEATRAVVVGVFGDLLIPAGIGWFVVDLRAWMAKRGWVLSAMPKAWDYFFFGLRGRTAALVFTLKDGRKVGGFWAEEPMASSYPADEDVLITAVVKVDENGRFLNRITGATGMLIARSDILTIESYDAAAVAAESNALSGTTVPQPPAPMNDKVPGEESWLTKLRNLVFRTFKKAIAGLQHPPQS